MAATCTWKPCTESEEEPSVIVKFSNGEVKNIDQLNFQLFTHSNNVNPRKKHRRMVVAESERLSYVGSNFGSGSLQCNSMCNYFVGVLDKTTMEMKLQKAQFFNLQPIIPGETTANTEDNETKTYREKLDALIEAFGTRKQKRALSSRRMNEVGNDTLQRAVARAASNIIEQKGLEALQQEVADSQAQTKSTLFLPPCNRDAVNREEVYPFSGLLSPAELDSLKQVGEQLLGLISEDKLSTSDYVQDQTIPKTVQKILKDLPKAAEDRERETCSAWYLSFLIRLAQIKKLQKNFCGSACPTVVFRKVQKDFTVESFDKGRLKNTVTSSSVSKIASHCLALLLHIGDKNVDLTLLHRDLALSETRMIEVAKAMGLTLSRKTVHILDQPEIQNEHRMASLVLPLVHYEHRMENRKRKKMT